MVLKSNYHTHTMLCGHAKGTILDYINEAHKLGYKTLGFSEHAPLPLEAFNEYDNKRLYAYENMSLDVFNNVYLYELEEYKKNKDIDIKIGLESEYLEEYDSFYRKLRDKVEYMILGVHFFKYKGKLIDTYSEIDEDTIDGYVLNIENALKSGMFNYLAHPDLFLYNNIEFNDKFREASNKIIDLCIKYNVYLEINCNGKGKYPRREFYECIKNKPVKLIIGIDCHDPKRLCGNHILESINLAKELKLECLDNIEV